MSTSQTELRNTELQQQQSTGLTTAKQLIRRKGKITPLSTTPQSNTNDIARSSCIDLTSTPSARTTSEAKHQYPHNQIITTSTSECVNDTQPQSLSGTEERSSCSTSIPSSEMLSANTCIHVLPSPETARIRPSQHHQTHDTITPQHISTIDQSPNSRSSILSFLWTVSSRLNNNVKSDIRCNAFSPSLASIHQPHHQQFKSLNESSITGSTNSTTNCAPDDLQVTEASSISHLDAPIPFGALTFDISRTKDDNDDNGSDYQKSFCTSRQNSRTSVANSAALSTGEGLQKTSLLLADQSCEKRQKCRDSFGVDLNGDHQETASLRIDGDVQRSPSEQSTDVTQSEAGTASIDHHQHPVYTASALCQCPCRNCATCPLRATRGKREVRRRDVNKDFNNEDDKDELHEQKNPSFLMRIKTRMINFCMMEAEDNPARFKYDVSVIPKEPLPKGKQRLLEITELPFLILWVYFVYWAVIAAMTATYSPSTVWLSAAVASVLVGIGLNANAYKSVTVPRRRGSIRHHRHARALLELRRYGESIDSVEMKIDWGIVIRFFIIPFGVSSLSGLTNSNREAFLLVFPRDPFYLTIAILCPTVVITILGILRILLLWRLKVRWSFQVLFLNGALVD